MSRRALAALFAVFFAAAGLWFAWSQYRGWDARFQEICPNKDTLLWDANMRSLQALDAVADLGQGIVWPPLSEIAASPTWPPLRVLFSIGILAAHGTPDMVLDMVPSAVFFFMLIPLFAAFSVSIRLEEGGIRTVFNGLLFLASLFLIVGLVDLPKYIFSSMLEIQGIFFFTWNAWTIYLLYKHFDLSESPGPVSRILRASFFLSGLGLYLTKYPYGILTGLALLAVELLRSPHELVRATLTALRSRYRGWRLAPFGLLAVAALLILVGPHLAHDLVNTRLAKTFIYLALLWIFIDFNLYLWKHRPESFPPSTRFVYLWFLFPFVALVLSHPDRFGSLIQAQTDRVAGPRTYVLSLFVDYFLQNRVFSALILGGLIVGLFAIVVPDFWARFRKGTRVPIPPELSMVAFLWCNVLVMEFLTSNKQARYVFQILPLLLFFHGNLFWMAAHRLRLPVWVRQGLPIVIVLSLALLALFPLTGVHEPHTRAVCFSGLDPAPFDGARRLAAWIPGETNAILVNDFHAADSVRAGRAQATEIDVFLRVKVWGTGQIRTDSKYRFSDWHRFQEVLHVTSDCTPAVEEPRIRERAGQVHATLERVDQYSDVSGICAVRYRIVRSAVP